MESISKKMKVHYEKTFSKFGANSRGVDWGRDEDVVLRYKNMLAIVNRNTDVVPTLLDVGCGYGGLLQYVKNTQMDVEYTGIDVAENMIKYARLNYENGAFFAGDALHFPFEKRFDYVVCNGILTQKLAVTTREMGEFANALIYRMFELCEIGIAFNIMSDKVNFTTDNLYYRSPVELLSYCLDHLSRRVRIDHSYPLYEYTAYVFKES